MHRGIVAEKNQGFVVSWCYWEKNAEQKDEKCWKCKLNFFIFRPTSLKLKSINLRYVHRPTPWAALQDQDSDSCPSTRAPATQQVEVWFPLVRIALKIWRSTNVWIIVSLFSFARSSSSVLDLLLQVFTGVVRALLLSFLPGMWQNSEPLKRWSTFSWPCWCRMLSYLVCCGMSMYTM